MRSQHATGTIDTKHQTAKVAMSLAADIGRPVTGKTVQVSQPADATHRTTSVKESARRAYDTGY